MIRGNVEHDEARIRLTVFGGADRRQVIEATIDTGYTGMLTLPSNIIAALGQRWYGQGRGILADWSECLFNVYRAAVGWNRRRRPIRVSETDAHPLVGMTLLAGHELRVEVRPHGRVEIRRL